MGKGVLKVLLCLAAAVCLAAGACQTLPDPYISGNVYDLSPLTDNYDDYDIENTQCAHTLAPFRPCCR